MKKILLVLGMLSILAIVGCVNTEPKKGDCVDVAKYGLKEATRYCKVAGNVQKVLGGWAFDLQQPCDFFVCESCTSGCIPPNFDDGKNCRWYPLRSANTIDGKIVSTNLCN